MIRRRLIQAALLIGVAAAVSDLGSISAQDRPAPENAGQSSGPETIGVPAKPGEPAPPAPVALDDLIRIGLDQNPKLAQAGFAIDAARGRALQAGLYPNPTVSATLDELGDRTGPGGINTIPLVSQEIVTAGKLKLDRAAAWREVDQSTLALLNQRYQLLAGIRLAFFDVLTLNRRIAILAQLSDLVEQSVATTRRLYQSGILAELDVLQLEVELGRLQVERAAALRELPAALRRLATAVGVPDLPITAITGSLDMALPEYELNRVQACVLSVHPELKSAIIGIDKARLVLRRAEVQPIPNVTVGAGYVRQNQNRSDDWTIGVSVPVPLWNRNQGNIQAARAMLAEATKEVARVENDLVDRVAQSMREFAAARQRVESLRSLRAKADQAVKIVRESQTMTTLQRLESQRQLSVVELEYIRALGDAWKSASVISGLTLEEQWPCLPVVSSP